jgi:hypothetical protein
MGVCAGDTRGRQTSSVYDVGTRISSIAIYLYVVKERLPHLRALLTKPLHASGIPIHQVWHGVYLRSACCMLWQNDLLVVIATETEPSSYPLPLCCTRTSPKTTHCTSFVSRELHFKPSLQLSSTTTTKHPDIQSKLRESVGAIEVAVAWRMKATNVIQLLLRYWHLRC